MRSLKRSCEKTEALFITAQRAAESGLDVSQMIALLPLSEVQRMASIKRAKAGDPISKIGLRDGWLNQSESQLVRIGELSGLPEKMFSSLADLYAGYYQRFLLLKSELMYPVALVTLALLLSVLFSFLQTAEAGQIGLTGKVFLLGLWLVGLNRAYDFLKYKRLGPYKNWWLKLVDWRSRNHLPGLVADRDFLLLFHSLISAGEDYQSALSKIGLVWAGPWRKRCQLASSQVGKGGGLINALRDNGVIQSREVLTFMRTADHGGRLVPEMSRLLTQLNTEIHEQTQFILGNSAKIIYFLVLVLVAGTIV